MSIETIEYKEYTINIERDLSPDNPFYDYDGLPILFVHSGGYLKSYSYNFNFNNSNFLQAYLPALNREEIKTSADALQILIDDSYVGLSKLSLVDSVDLANELLQELYSSISNKDKLKLYSEILKIKKVNHLLTSSTGYRQGDYADLLIIADSDYYKKTGASEKDSLEYYADLYSAWAWGDVYGYTILDKSGEEINGGCWSFYGDDHEKSGLLDCARSAIDCEIKHNNKQRLDKLKVLLKNRVPLELRCGLLSGKI